MKEKDRITEKNEYKVKTAEMWRKELSLEFELKFYCQVY